MPEITKTRRDEPPKDRLRDLAEDRLKDFQVLRKNARYHGAVYLAFYAIELYLKYAICVLVKGDKLHKLLHHHRLWDLMYFTGLEKAMETEAPARFESFKAIAGQKDQEKYLKPDDIRYSIQEDYKEDCGNWDLWLNDVEKGIIPWLREKLK